MSLIVLCVVAVLVACILSPAARRVIGWTVAVVWILVVLAIAAVVALALRDINRGRQARERIAPREVRIDDLRLTGNSADTYRLTGTVRNLSARYTLTDVTFALVVEDCVSSGCTEQARGHGEVIRRVPPRGTVEFSVDTVVLPGIAPGLGERRLSYRVWNTWGMP